MVRIYFGKTVWQSFIAIVLSLLVAINALAAPPRPRVAVVLGGGAARGFSHIGLLQALEEEGIPIDILVGTSMGSIVAGLYASGISTDNLAYLVTRVDLTEFFRPLVPPEGGFISTEQFEVFLDELTDRELIENLPVPFYSVITNIVTGEEVALNEGSLSRGILASMSIPGMFPPVQIGDDFYVDGGMLSPVPVRAARAAGADFVIAVDVRRELEEIDHANVLTNLQLSLFFLLDANTMSQLELADIVVAPDVELDSYMDYDRGDYFIAQGYAAAKRAMPQIKALLEAKQADFPFQSQPIVSGLSADEFARRVDDALVVVTEQSRAGSEGTRLSLSLGHVKGLATHIAHDFSLGQISEVAPLFGTYSGQNFGAGWRHILGVGAGNCRAMCASVFARYAPADHRWSGGLSLRGALGKTFAYAGEWEGIGVEPRWHASFVAPASRDRTVHRNEFQVRFGQANDVDDQSVYEGEVLYRLFFPGERRDLWEAIRAATHGFLGLGSTIELRNGNSTFRPTVEAGVEFEARLFGLYPMRSRASVVYTAGDHPWALRLTLGDWL